MTGSSVADVVINHKFQRILGTYGGYAPGPLLVCIGGIHGNEPAGALALQRVLKQLSEIRPHFKGELVALAGNVQALNRGCRYQDRDLNRMWNPKRVRLIKMHSRVDEPFPEEQEQQELLAAIEAALRRAKGDPVFLDLHTTSSAGPPFAIISDTLVNRRFAFQLRVPVILGLEENLDGTILNYINELGYAAIGFEGGQHHALSSISHHEATIWTTLVVAGCLDPREAPDFDHGRRRLAAAAGRLPRILELRHRHGIQPDDQFVMQPGFSNFHPVEKGETLATDRRGQVRATERGLLFMPLYQKQGEDGFFLIRRVNPIWMKLAAWLRRKRAERILPRLPGVQRVPGHPDSLVINTRIARWFVIEICHLMGFRKHSLKDSRLIVMRRKQSPAD
jgi:succinylglutamate desuccinylase